MKPVNYRIRTDLAEKLRRRAQRNKRSATKELEAILERSLQNQA